MRATDLQDQLAQIRERLRTANRDASHVQIFDNMDASLQDMPRLLEAVEAVLKEAGDADQQDRLISPDILRKRLTDNLGADDEQ